jgi:hypothetical protein
MIKNKEDLLDEIKHTLYIKNKKPVRKYNLGVKYGLTPELYVEMLSRQDFKCAICGTDKPSNKDIYFHVDHDHATNEIRGLLCLKCNMGLGYFNDNIKTLSNAIRYLRDNKRLDKDIDRIKLNQDRKRQNKTFFL